MDDAAVVWLLIAAICFALDFVLGLLADPRTARVRLIAAGLFAMALAFITERTN